MRALPKLGQRTFQPVHLSISDARAGTTPISPCPEDARGFYLGDTIGFAKMVSITSEPYSI